MMKWSLTIVLVFALANSFAQHQTEGKIPFQLGIPIKPIDSKDLEEVSGMVFGNTHPERIYVHNDSGDKPIVYVLDTLGNRIGKIKLLDVKNRDWEEIAIGPGRNNLSNIYIGDIGDNKAEHKDIAMLRFAEPTNLDAEVVVEKLILNFPNGAMDAESMFVDPISSDIYLFSKREKLTTIFKVSQEAFDQKNATLVKVGKLTFTGAVAADISQDGKQILIKNYFSIFYWERNLHETIEETLLKEPLELPYSPEPQGEAIGFTSDGSAFYTLSEKRFEFVPVLYRYPALKGIQ